MGVIPTPGVAHLANQFPVLAGIVVSASHNPYHDNGIKFFGPEGTKLPDAVESEIEKHIHGEPVAVRPSRGRAPAAKRASSPSLLVKKYSSFLQETFPQKLNLKNLKLAIDCANGATYKVAPRLFGALGAEIVAINVDPDGRNINRSCGSLHPDKLSKEVVKLKCDCGLAFDGDGDRVIFVDENGDVRDGDYILAMVSRYLKEKGKLKNNTLVTTVMANLGLFKAMEKYDISVLKTPVGDRYVYERMKSSGAVIGGEQSGHIIFRNFLPTGDGMLSALQVMSILKETGQSLSDLCGLMEKFPQILINTPVKKKVPLAELPRTSSLIKDIEDKLGSNGRVLVRYSGTENLLRVMVEGQDKQSIAEIAQEVSGTAQQEIERMK